MQNKKNEKETVVLIKCTQTKNKAFPQKAKTIQIFPLLFASKYNC